MSFDKTNRRVHLSLGLLLAPWLFMYGLSSFIIIHQKWFGPEQPSATETLFDKPYQRALEVPDKTDEPALRRFARDVLNDIGLEGAFWVDRPTPETVHIERFTFADSIALTYSVKEHTLKAERRRMSPSQTIVRFHFRGGYSQPGMGNSVWGAVVDLSCLGILVWVASGLFMWWRLKALRVWGALAVFLGLFSFILLLATL